MLKGQKNHPTLLSLKNSVFYRLSEQCCADPHQFAAHAGRTYHFDVDPGLFLFDADPVPGFYFDGDPVPNPTFHLMRVRRSWYAVKQCCGSASHWCGCGYVSDLSLPCLSGLGCGSWFIFDKDLDADTNTAGHPGADPDPGSLNDADPDPQHFQTLPRLQKTPLKMVLSLLLEPEFLNF